MHHLQPMVTAPLLDPPEGLFSVTEEKLEHSDKLFSPEHGKTWRTFKGAIDHTKLENVNIPEVGLSACV